MSNRDAFQILIFGSDEKRLKALKLLLKKEDRLLVTVGGSFDQLENALHQRFSLLLVDIPVLESETFFLLQSYRAEDRLAQIPIVFAVNHFSAFIIPDDVGPVDVVPNIPELIKFKVSTLLKLYKQESELKRNEKKMLEVQKRLEQEIQYHKDTEAILSENERTLRRIFRSIECSSEAILITEKSEIIYYANPAFYTLTGYQADETFAAKPGEFFDFQDLSIDFDQIKKVARETGSWQNDVTLARKDGSLYQAYLDVNAVMTAKGDFDGFIVIQRDITTLKNIMNELELLARIDALTGLYNRRYLMERLSEELARAKRFNRSMCMLLIDLDHFKVINDSYGHGTGDLVLERVGELITIMIRSVDIAGRYGGEELCIALPETPIEGGQTFAERFRMQLQQQVFYTEDKQSFGVTCSIGLVHMNMDNDLDSHFLLVDKALYRAKHRGRNRVELAP